MSLYKVRQNYPRSLSKYLGSGGNHHAFAGFDAADGKTRYQLRKSCTADAFEVATDTNIVLPGAWVFRVTSGIIIALRCPMSSRPRLDPRPIQLLQLLQVLKWKAIPARVSPEKPHPAAHLQPQAQNLRRSRSISMSPKLRAKKYATN